MSISNDPLVTGINRSIKDNNNSFDITKTALVTAVSTATTGYSIKLDGVTYANIKVLNGESLSVNNTVVVCIPQGNYNNMFILGKLS